jgi:hypothetical protein
VSDIASMRAEISSLLQRADALPARDHAEAVERHLRLLRRNRPAEQREEKPVVIGNRDKLAKVFQR